jgi:hypothetical protein
MSESLLESKICIQKILDIHFQEFNDIYSSNHAEEHVKKLQAAFFTKKLWPDGSKIRIAFLGAGDTIKRTDLSKEKDLDPLQNDIKLLSVQEAIKKIVKERIEPLVNLDIAFVDSPKDANVRISFNPEEGSWSLVGTDHLEQKEGATMNFGWFDAPTTIHEFGHLIGLIHEHQNPAGQKIQWDTQKVIEWAKETQGWSEQTTKENIINKYDKNSINGSDFDPLSIMLYFFPGSLTTNNKGTQQNFRLSGEDVVWINKTYNPVNGITPETFYQSTYGISLKDSISKSKNLAMKFSSNNWITNNWITNNWIIIIFIILAIAIVVFVIIYLLKKRATSKK